ncbi:hypothetical protein EsH8_VI_000168 [Colletotrichum jinshuiense]
MIPSLFNGTISSSGCSAANVPYPALSGVDFLSLETNLVANLSRNIGTGAYVNHGAVNVTNANFCNVSISYTHPGGNDLVNVQVWLPTENWNGRLQAIGGAGWQAGLHYAGLMGMTASVGEGYATVSTDAGLSSGSEVTPAKWGLIEEGKPNIRLLQNLASDSLHEAAVIAKSITAAFYGEPAKYSYFTGCSQGGRQGLMLAQKYPNDYDGIAAAAPAINWNSIAMQNAYPAFLMDLLREYPPSCEIDALTAAAIKACDGDDGLMDGILSDIGSCDFDPMSLVGTVINCTNFGTPREISLGAAQVISGAWDGAKRKDNSSIWFGPNKDAILTGSITDISVVPTTCKANGTCTAGNAGLFSDWIKLFVLKNSSAPVTGLTQDEFDRIFDLGSKEYDSILATNEPDLSAFHQHGGKMITYHGMADSVIPARGSVDYYEKVMSLDSDVKSFYRLFLAPGIHHCYGGPGGYPDTTFESLVQWVESDIAPDTLTATSVDTNPIIQRPLCPFPLKQVYSKSALGTEQEFSCQ